MADGDAPPPDVPHFDTRFMVQTPDGSTATQVLRTDRPLSTDELAAHVESQGNTFAGYPDAAPAAPAPAAFGPATADAAPLPSAVAPTSGTVPTPADTTPPAAVAAPDQLWTQRAKGVYLPERSFKSQVPSIVGATIGAGTASVAGPFAPYVAPFTAAVGGGLGEGADIAYEKLTGATPAEAAPAWDRIQNAAIRSGTFEGLTAPVAWALRPVMTAVKPIANAVGDLLPVLRQGLPEGVKVVETTTPGVTRTIDSLLNPDNTAWLAKTSLTPEGQQTLFKAWWQRQAGQAPEKIAAAWDALPGSAQSRLAGDQRDTMQSLATMLKSGQDLPKLAPALYGAGGGAATTVASLLGHPLMGAALGASGLASAAGEAVPYVAARMVQRPTGAAVLSWLPRAAQVAAPLTRFGVQSAGTLGWPTATTLEP